MGSAQPTALGQPRWPREGGGWAGWRDRLLAAPRFQWWAARLPLVRRLARRHAERLFDLCSGFVASQVLYALVRTGLIDALRAGVRSEAELQARTQLPEDRLALLLSSGADLGLLESRGRDAWGLGLLGAALAGNPAVLRMIEHQPPLYEDLVDPVARLRGTAPPGALARYWDYTAGAATAPADPQASARYSSLMSATQALVAEDILHAYSFERHRVLMDVGGGDGTFLCTVARRHRALQLRLFDLPPVAGLAEARLASAGLATRASVHRGDFRRDPLPAGADLITLVRVLHDHDDPVALDLLRAIRQALAPGGRIVIGEPMADVRGSFPSATLYLRHYLLAMGQGRMRSPLTIAAMLSAAGFEQPREHATARPWQCAVVSAQAPAM